MNDNSKDIRTLGESVMSWTSFAVALPFYFSGSALFVYLIINHSRIHMFQSGQVICAAMLLLGCATGLQGAMRTMMSVVPSRRVDGIAGITMSTAIIIFSFSFQKFVSEGGWAFGESLLPRLILPSMLCIIGILLGIKSVYMKSSETLFMDEEISTTESQPQPLSQP